MIGVTANLQLTGWLTAKQLDVTAFALRLEHERGRGAFWSCAHYGASRVNQW